MFGIYIPANSAFFIHLQGLLYSMKGLLIQDHIVKIVDNGLTENQKNFIKKNYSSFINIEITPKKTYTTSERNAYKFKIDVIQMMVDDNYEYAMNMDCKNHLKINLAKIMDEVKKKKILCNISGEIYEHKFTHPKAFITMNVNDNDEIKNSWQIQAGNIVYHLPQALDIMKEIIKYGNDPFALYPPGSDLSNHRQDQSVCSVILKKNNIEPSGLFYATVHNTIVKDIN